MEYFINRVITFWSIWGTTVMCLIIHVTSSSLVYRKPGATSILSLLSLWFGRRWSSDFAGWPWPLNARTIPLIVIRMLHIYLFHVQHQYCNSVFWNSWWWNWGTAWENLWGTKIYNLTLESPCKSEEARFSCTPFSVQCSALNSQ